MNKIRFIDKIEWKIVFDKDHKEFTHKCIYTAEESEVKTDEVLLEIRANEDLTDFFRYYKSDRRLTVIPTDICFLQNPIPEDKQVFMDLAALCESIKDHPLELTSLLDSYGITYITRIIDKPGKICEYIDLKLSQSQHQIVLKEICNMLMGLARYEVSGNLIIFYSV